MLSSGLQDLDIFVPGRLLLVCFWITALIKGNRMPEAECL